MKLVSITLSLLALAAGAHAGNPTMDDDAMMLPTPEPTHFTSVAEFRAHRATHSMASNDVDDDSVDFPTPQPSESNIDAQWRADWIPTPLPTETTDSASGSPSVEQLALAAEVADSAVGEAYAVTREEVAARSSSYVVPVAVAGCLAAVVGIAAVLVVMQKRKRARKAAGGEVDYSDEIVTPV